MISRANSASIRVAMSRLRHCPEEIESIEQNCEDNTVGGKHNKSRQDNNVILDHETDHEGDECPGQDYQSKSAEQEYPTPSGVWSGRLRKRDNGRGRLNK